MKNEDRRNLPLSELEAFMQKVDKLRAEGLSDAQISIRVGVARTTIVQRRKRLRDIKNSGS